jgi:hypothetical protein
VSYELSVIYAAKNKKKKKDITCQHTKNKKEDSSTQEIKPMLTWNIG